MIAALLALGLHIADAAERRFVPAEGARPAAATAEHLAQGGAWPTRVQEGARQLKARFEFVDWCRMGLEMLYHRRYRDSRALFAELQEEFPGTAVAPIADILVWQAMMLENFDFRYDAQYRTASGLARTQLEAAAQAPGNDGWEQFMLAGVVGLEAIHGARQGKYLPALTQAFQALEHVSNVRAVAPDLVDLSLADGLYNYWRTALAQSSALIPDFGDHRAEGIAQIVKVEDRGVFLGPPATLSMVFTWLEEKDYDKALASCLKNHAIYPDNVINELMTGMIRLKRQEHAAALDVFDGILRLDRDNSRVHYLRGVALLRLTRLDEARQELEGYLGHDHLQTYQRGGAHWRLGEVYEKLGRFADAELQYRAAEKLGINEAKVSLAKLREQKASGQITW